MSKESKEIYEFGTYRLDVGEHIFERADGEKNGTLTEKAFQTLVILVRNRGSLVTKNELLASVWPDAIVEENNLDKAVHAIRHALNDTPGEQKYIETVRKHGYRFVAEVRKFPADVNVENRTINESFTGVAFPEASEAPAESSVDALTVPISKAADKNATLAFAEETRPVDSPNKRRTIAALAAIVLLAAAIGFGYYFFSAKTSPIVGKKSIAVLPLKPINTANRDDIYEVGIADSLIHRLGSIKGFIVRPLSATRKYADIEQDPFAAGKEQQVDYVLTSNYQVAGGKIRITAQLFNVQSGEIEETYKIEKETSDVFAMQDEIAGEVGKQLQARFVTTSNTPGAKRGTNNEEAFRLYLQGTNLTARRTAADAKKAVEYFEQAIKLDPNFARAYAGMASAYIASGNLGGGSPREQFEKAKSAVTKALELDNNLAEAYVARAGITHRYDWDWVGAEKDLLHAIELEPNNDGAHGVYANLLVESGRFDEGMAELETAQAINPVSPGYQRNRGQFLYFARRYDEAIVQLKRVIEVDENYRTAYAWLWYAYQMKGDDEAAYQWFMKFQKLANPEIIEPLQMAYQTAGWQGVKRKKLEIDKQNEHQPGSNLFATARLCALLGEKEQAFDYLNKAIEKRYGQMVALKADPTFDSLRSDPRFDELLKRVGLK